MSKLSRVIQFPVLLIVFFIIAALPGQADAFLLCRSDPQVILSNGVILHFGASIGSLPTQVLEVHYEVHVPVGLTQKTIFRTHDWVNATETFTFVADQKPSVYRVITQVRTTKGNASITAYANTIRPSFTKQAVSTISGREGDRLSLTFIY